MGEPISIAAKTAFQQADQQTQLKSQTGNNGGRTFDQVYQETGKQSDAANPNAQNAATINADRASRVPNNARVEALQTNLTERLNGMPNSPTDAPTKVDIYADWLDKKTRMGLLGEALNGINKTSPNGVNMLGRFGQLESEMKSVDALMKSNKDFSPGELLGLQARLYQVGQHIEVMSKVVDQVTGGIKTILNTNV